MRTAIGVHDGPVSAVGQGRYSSVQHRVHQLGVWTCADGPADNQTIEAVDHGRQVHLAALLVNGRSHSPLTVGNRPIKLNLVGLYALGTVIHL